MSYLSVSDYIADILQLVVAIYALRLNQLFGATRVGWSLFCAFSLLGPSEESCASAGARTQAKARVMRAMRIEVLPPS